MLIQYQNYAFIKTKFINLSLTFFNNFNSFLLTKSLHIYLAKLSQLYILFYQSNKNVSFNKYQKLDFIFIFYDFNNLQQYTSQKQNKLTTELKNQNIKKQQNNLTNKQQQININKNPTIFIQITIKTLEINKNPQTNTNTNKTQSQSNNPQTYYQQNSNNFSQRKEQKDYQNLTFNNTQKSAQNSELPNQFEQQENIVLQQCPEGCGRKFKLSVLEKHVKICQKVFQGKRKPFKVDLVDDEAKNLANKNSTKPQTTKSKTQKVLKWKKQSQMLSRGLQAQNDKTEGGSQPLIIQEQEDDIIKCGGCGKKFNQVAASKHIPSCFGHNLDWLAMSKIKQNKNSLIKI